MKLSVSVLSNIMQCNKIYFQDLKMSDFEDDNGPPPLEDLSEEIATALNLKTSLTSVTQPKTSISNSNCLSSNISVSSEIGDSVNATVTEKLSTNTNASNTIETPGKSKGSAQISSKQTVKAGFSGMNKGFLFGSGPKKTKSKPQVEDPKTSQKMTVIKSQPQNSSLKFEEVQKSQSEAQPAWITDSLLG